MNFEGCTKGQLLRIIDALQDLIGGIAVSEADELAIDDTTSKIVSIASGPKVVSPSDVLDAWLGEKAGRKLMLRHPNYEGPQDGRNFSISLFAGRFETACTPACKTIEEAREKAAEIIVERWQLKRGDRP